MNWKIPLFKIYWDQRDIKNVNKLIRSGMHWAEGQSIAEFEKRLARYLGVKYCLVFNSGTSALHAALLAYGIKKGDEVIVPSFTFIATANAALFVGAKPVFADIEEETLGLDPKDVVKKITPRTKAIICVHYGGCPCKVKELKKIAQKRNLVLIEDAAEALGAELGKKKIGTFGNCAILSFCQNKIITTGEGGAVVTDSPEIYARMKLIRSHGRLAEKNYFSSVAPFDYIALGYNFRMPTPIAALGISQLAKIDRLLRMRKNIAKYLTAKLSSEIKEIALLSVPKGYISVYQIYSIRVRKYRDELMRYLAGAKIMSKVYFPPVHLTYFYRYVLKERTKLPITEKVSREVLSLPFYPALTRDEIDYIVKKIKKFFRGGINHGRKIPKLATSQNKRRKTY